MSELNSPPERENSLDDPLLAHIKACLTEVLRTAEQIREQANRERLRRAIIREFSRPTDDDEGGGFNHVTDRTICLDL
jgi:hypothetical protein